MIGCNLIICFSDSEASNCVRSHGHAFKLHILHRPLNASIVTRIGSPEVAADQTELLNFKHLDQLNQGSLPGEDNPVTTKVAQSSLLPLHGLNEHVGRVTLHLNQLDSEFVSTERVINPVDLGPGLGLDDRRAPQLISDQTQRGHQARKGLRHL